MGVMVSVYIADALDHLSSPSCEEVRRVRATRGLGCRERDFFDRFRLSFVAPRSVCVFNGGKGGTGGEIAIAANGAPRRDDEGRRRERRGLRGDRDLVVNAICISPVIALPTLLCVSPPTRSGLAFRHTKGSNPLLKDSNDEQRRRRSPPRQRLSAHERKHGGR